MKKILFINLVILLCSCASSQKQTSLLPLPSKYVSKIDREETKEILYQLASDQLNGRKPGSKGYTDASNYVINYLKKTKIKPLFKDGYKDIVTNFKEVSANIVGVIGDYDKTKPHIIIGAHLDHLGNNTNTEDSIFNGANDNASGVTAVLQIAKEFHNSKFKKNIIIALFTEEETGLIGSKHLAKRLKKEKYNIEYMLNFEMIGKTKSTGKNKVYITGYNKSDLAEKMNAIAGRKFVEFLPKAVNYDLFKHSDNYSFYKEFKVPCHTISSFDFENYEHYHKVSDEVTLLDIDNMNDIINTCATIMHNMLSNNITLTPK